MKFWKSIVIFFSERDEEQNQSIAYLAHSNGSLGELTRLLHRYLMHGQAIHPDLTLQYQSDIKETWIFGSNLSERNKRCNILKGRLYELAFYAYLESIGWKVAATEALGATSDVIATFNGNHFTTFEVKSIGHERTLAELEMKALKNEGDSCGSISVYSPLDYLLYRIYEAAVQLEKSNGRKIACVVVDDYEVNYKIPLSESWINWKNPKFFERDDAISDFLSKERAKNENLDSDLSRFISNLDEIWVLRQISVFNLEKVFTIKMQV